MHAIERAFHLAGNGLTIKRHCRDNYWVGAYSSREYGAGTVVASTVPGSEDIKAVTLEHDLPLEVLLLDGESHTRARTSFEWDAGYRHAREYTTYYDELGIVSPHRGSILDHFGRECRALLTLAANHTFPAVDDTHPFECQHSAESMKRRFAEEIACARRYEQDAASSDITVKESLGNERSVG